MKIAPEFLLDYLFKNGIRFFAGVPDSTLKNLCTCIADKTNSREHVICANEGGAVGIGAGYHLATGKVPAIYLQNSGLGNIINPLVSVADPMVYDIPMLFIIGWRGMPGVKDEPQHSKQGRITLELLDVLGIKSFLMNENFAENLDRALLHIKNSSKSAALVVPKGMIDAYPQAKRENHRNLPLTRESAIEKILTMAGDRDIFVSTTGMASRELFEIRENNDSGHAKDFLTVGGMGHASQIALGIAMQNDRKVICLDGDGAFIMHMGACGVNAFSGCSNLIHIVLNNGAHDSVGGQPTLGFKMNLAQIALASGYREAGTVCDESELQERFFRIKEMEGPVFLEVQVKKGHRKDLGRPTRTPLENKQDFMEYLK